MASVEINKIYYPCPKYEKAAKKLLKKVSKASTLNQIQKLFNAFAKKYTVIEYIWLEWIRRESDSSYKDYQDSFKASQIEKIKKLASTHFYSVHFQGYSNKTFKDGKFGRSLMWSDMNKFYPDFEPPKNEPFSTEFLYPALIYPHNYQKIIKKLEKMYSLSPLPKEVLQKYDESCQIFDEIENGYIKSGDIFYSLEHLIKINYDQTFIIENFEICIGAMPGSKMPWKMYFDYLKSQNLHKKVLNLCSRFCRLFIEFSEGKEIYRREMEEQGKEGRDVSKWWIDTIEAEKDFVGIDSARDILDKALKISKEELMVNYGLAFERDYGTMGQYMDRYSWAIKNFPELKNMQISKKFAYPVIKAPINFCHKPITKTKIEPKFLQPRPIQPPKYQSFSLPPAIITYLNEYANFATLRKLYAASKYFFLKSKSLLCHNLTILEGSNENPIFFPHSLFITTNYANFLEPLNFTITNALIIYPRGSPYLFSDLLPSLTLAIKYLILTDQILTFSEFQRLATLKLKHVILDMVIFYMGTVEYTDLPVEEVISMLPYAKNIGLLNMYFTSETSQNLSKMERKTKLKTLKLSLLDDDFNVYDFIEFVKNNALQYAEITVVFRSNVTDESRDLFEEIFIEKLPDVLFWRK